MAAKDRLGSKPVCGKREELLGEGTSREGTAKEEGALQAGKGMGEGQRAWCKESQGLL